MFENIGHFFKRMVKTEQQKELGSKDAAKERLHLVLMQDRANVSADFLELMKQEIIDVIKKYIVVDEDQIDVRLTNELNEDGTNGAPALFANIPIVNIKNDMMAEKIKSFEGVDFNKEMGITSNNNKNSVSTEISETIELPPYGNTLAQSNINIEERQENVEQEEVKEMFEEIDEDDDDDITFDDLLKAAEAADKELKENQKGESGRKKEVIKRSRTTKKTSRNTTKQNPKKK